MDLAASAAHAARPLVLVVEDDERLGPIVGRMLERSGYDHVLATTGDDALRAMRDREPVAAVVDIMIAHPDGIEVCRKFRRDSWPGTLVVMSARSSPDDRRRALAAGADAFLPKPFRLPELVATLAGVRPAPVSAPDHLDPAAEHEPGPATWVR